VGGELTSLARTAGDRGHGEQSLSWWQQATRAHRRAADRFPGKPIVQNALAETLFSLSRVQRRLGRPAEAMASALEIRQRWPRNNVHLYNAACEMALCVPLVGAGKSEGTPQEQELRGAYTRQALSTLQQAIDAGYANFVHLRQDRDFDAIRSSVEFQRIASRSGQGGAP
jgi:hypothetical protein